MSMRETRPKISLALSTVRSKVCDVGARLEYERTLHTWAKFVKSFLRILPGWPSVFKMNPRPGMHRAASISLGSEGSLQYLEYVGKVSPSANTTGVSRNVLRLSASIFTRWPLTLACFGEGPSELYRFAASVDSERDYLNHALYENI